MTKARDTADIVDDVSVELASKLPYSYGTATPSTTDSGFLWYDSNSTPAAPKFWDGAAFVNLQGFHIMRQESFTAVSSVSLDNVFTTAYSFYVIQLRQELASGGVNLAFRMRASGVDETGLHYDQQNLVVAGTSVSATRTTDQGSGYPGDARQGAPCDLIMYLSFPRAGEQTDYKILERDTTNQAEMKLHFGRVQTGTSYDGITISTPSSTITGKLSVYAY